MKKHPDSGAAIERYSPAAPGSWPSRHASGVAFRREPIGGGGDAPRVLLIASEPAAYRRALEPSYEVETADSGGSALEILLWDATFRLVLCAHRLPDLYAAEFLHKLRGLRSVRCPPVVVFGGEDPREIIRCLEVGIRHYATGPCPPSELLAKVDRLLQFVRFERLAK